MSYSDIAVWTQSEAIELCRQIEAICPKFGCHVALTGGLLYRDGMRKDADVLFYRIRQCPEINVEGLWEALKPIGFEMIKGCGFIFKATWSGKPVDCFFPEEICGEYLSDPSPKEMVAAFCAQEAPL